MPLDLLFEISLLLAAVVAAFAISSVVGMLVERFWATPHPISGASGELGPPPWRPDPAYRPPIGRPPPESLAPANDPLD